MKKSLLLFFLFNTILCYQLLAQSPTLWGITTEGGVASINHVPGGTIYSVKGDGTAFNRAHTFEYDNPGRRADRSKLFEASNGKFYGVTSQGGNYDRGTLFEYDLVTNTYFVKHHFGNGSDGVYPFGSLVELEGVLYGTTNGGGIGPGTIYSYDYASENYTILHNFNNNSGTYPYGNLLYADSNLLYGMTNSGGAPWYKGVLFELNISTNTYTVKINFNDTTGRGPQGSLMKASNGKLIGLTSLGGANNQGTIFEYDYLTNIFVKKIDFNSAVTGGSPRGEVVEAPNGKFYGMTRNGGTSDDGVIFEYDYSANTIVKKHDFSGLESNPLGSLMLAGNNKMYGQTSHSLFEYDYINDIYTQSVLFKDMDALYGYYGTGTLMESSNGKLYGINQIGGRGHAGTIFEFDYLNNQIIKKIDFTYAPAGAAPGGSLTKAPNGKFYGMTNVGGNSNVYSLNGFVLFEFDPATNIYTKKLELDSQIKVVGPHGDLLLASNGKFYGMTETYRDTVLQYGSLFEYDYVANTLTVKHLFQGSTEGSSPSGSLIQATNGKLYGMTYFSGTGGGGTLFEYDYSTNIFSVKVSFNYPSMGGYSKGDLMQALNGKLYGTTSMGGANHDGVLFEYDIVTNIYTKKYDFNQFNCSGPIGNLVEGTKGKLYGFTTKGSGGSNGAFFEYNYISNVFTKKASSFYSGGLMKASNGKFYFSSNHDVKEYEPINNTFIKILDFNDSTGSYPSYTKLLEVSANEISTNPVAAKICAGNSINVSFISVGTYNPGNVFTAQLSNYNGNFSTYVNIGSYTSRFPGTIHCNIPTGIKPGGKYRIRVVSNNVSTIGTDNGSDIIISNSVPAPGITSSTGFCRPSSNNIYKAFALQNGIAYNWTLPQGALINTGQGSDSIQVSFSVNASSGNVCVAATNGCGSNSFCKPIEAVYTVPPTPGTINGSNNGCPGDSQLYSINRVNHADYYLWTPPFGSTINGSSNALLTTDTSVNIVFTSTYVGDTIHVRSVNCLGNSVSERFLPIRSKAPSTNGPITGMINGLCNQSNQIYFINNSPNTINYTWKTNITGTTINGSTLPVTTNNSVNVNFGSFISGQLFVKANNNCGSSAERSLTVNARPAVPASITGPVSVCDGDTVPYSTVAVANASSYNWTTLSGSSILTGQGATSAIIKLGNVATSGLVRVRSQNSCASSAYVSKSVTVNSCPRMMDATMQSHLTIQPNPFSITTTIILSSAISLEKSELLISDIYGKEVRKYNQLSNYSIEIEKGQLSSGIYIVQLISNQRITATSKMIIQ